MMVGTEQDNGYLAGLKRLVDCHISTLEGMFGKKDARFRFGKIEKAGSDSEGPYLYYPENYCPDGCVVDIHVSRRTSRAQGLWQIAHECVHLLDPAFPSTIFLEEGLATWYQNEPSFHDDAVKTYISKNPTKTPEYIEAERLVRKCLPFGLIDAVRKTRARNIRICDINPDMLLRQMPEADKATIGRLCEKFPLL